MSAVALWAALVLTPAEHGQLRPMDAPHVRPPALSDGGPQAARDIGTPITLFVNFDGIELGSCNPSDAQRNCHWYNEGHDFEPFSGSLQTVAGVMQTVRKDVENFGIRVTGLRPDEGDYTMVIYGGSEEEFGSLGSAPSGDCYDQDPDQIAFAYLDGELNDWVHGGATTILQEAAHTWGLDHTDEQSAIMYPLGNNGPTSFRDGCFAIVDNIDLDPGEAKCPEVNQALCGSDNEQNSYATLELLFGPPYVDTIPPRLELLEPDDGQYFQRPANFDIRVGIEDDLHPQVYSAWLWANNDGPPAEPTQLVSADYEVSGLPVGNWTFHLVVADEAGNEASLDFEIEVGLDPPPTEDEGCGCAAGPTRRSVRGLGLAVWLLIVPARRRPR